MNLFDVEGKVVLITGSSRGLGYTFARGFAEAGATVVISSRTEENVERAVRSIRDSGCRAEGYVFDVTDRANVVEQIEQINEDLGKIDVLVNNAGIHRRAPLEQLTEQEWEEVIDVNLNAVFIVSKNVALGMIERKQGKIINISSLNAWGSRPTIANYCASKGGLNALTRSMATEWGKYNIQTNAIAPGYFVTDLTKPLVEDPKFDEWVRSEVPLGRWGDPEELVGTAIYLASRASDYVNGHIVYVDGGWSACL
jgi:gluconate 5-dehydrogenase